MEEKKIILGIEFKTNGSGVYWTKDIFNNTLYDIVIRPNILGQGFDCSGSECAGSSCIKVQGASIETALTNYIETSIKQFNYSISGHESMIKRYKRSLSNFLEVVKQHPVLQSALNIKDILE